jgi:hypothetical protein
MTYISAVVTRLMYVYVTLYRSNDLKEGYYHSYDYKVVVGRTLHFPSSDILPESHAILEEPQTKETIEHLINITVSLYFPEYGNSYSRSKLVYHNKFKNKVYFNYCKVQIRNLKKSQNETLIVEGEPDH